MRVAGCCLLVEDAGYHLQGEAVELNPEIIKSELHWVVPVVDHEVEFFHLEAVEDHLSHLRITIAMIPL